MRASVFTRKAAGYFINIKIKDRTIMYKMTEKRRGKEKRKEEARKEKPTGTYAGKTNCLAVISSRAR
jgi:DNA-binding transcriptional regulator PaaX